MDLSRDITRVQSAPVFVVVQRGAARVEVVELVSEAPVTVGRVPTNRIVLNDPKCSRQHCEFLHRDGRWFIRDLESRNGLTVDGVRVEGDWPLEFGQRVGIGGCSLLFTNRVEIEDEAERREAYSIIERKSATRYDLPSGTRRASQGLHEVSALFQLARRMNAATDLKNLGETVLTELLESTPAFLGAVLLGQTESAVTQTRDLVLIATRSRDDSVTPQISEYLSQVVLVDGEALLAHDISQHSFLAGRESLIANSAESAVCAPIRHHNAVIGLIHLYSTKANAPLDAQHLEFALAVADQMGAAVVAVRERQSLAEGLSSAESQCKELQQQLEVESELIGRSPPLDTVRKTIGRVAPTDATVLIRGESGVGKELVARALHLNSRRKTRPFVCVNCAALTESLLESELFGHEKGSFTGAAAQRAGKFEQADGGTLFLDEIGEMSLDIQAKFLRVLEGQSFERIGGSKPITVDVRVVAATNRRLEEAIRDGKFRQDLFFRLQVIEIIVPPLREHPDDIPLIAQHFVERYARKSRARVKGFSKEALETLKRHRWPGNVRELRNVVERAVILTETEWLTPGDVIIPKLDLTPRPATSSTASGHPTSPGQSVFSPNIPVSTVTAALGQPTDVPNSAADASPLDTAIDPVIDLMGSFVQAGLTLDDVDRKYIEAALHYCEWNKSQAARTLGIERTTLDRRLKKYGLARPGEEASDDEDETL